MPGWQRPWETLRDRSTFAMSFVCAFATEAFIDLSRTFLQAIRAGEVENQAPHSGEATVRLDDLYHLHRLAHGAHEAAAQGIGALSVAQRDALRQALGSGAAFALFLLALVHVTFVSPFSQLPAAQELSRTVYETGGWGSNVSEEESDGQAWSPTILRLEISNASWPERWLGAHIQWLEEAAKAPPEEPKEPSPPPGEQQMPNATSLAQGFGDVAFRRVAEFLVFTYNMAFPVPQYEVMYGASSASWLEVQSPQARSALGMHVVNLRVSARDSSLFGPQWAREILSLLRLYDVYVLNALPIHFMHMHGDDEATLRLHAMVLSGDARPIDLAPVAELVGMANSPRWPRMRWLGRRALSVFLALPFAVVGSLLLSAALRRLAVLCARLQIYSFYTLRQMRRYPFIAAPLRRVNCYSSNELLELWTAAAALAALFAWLLAEAAQLGGLWAGLLLCYALAEYWGIVHVRTVQSRWIFPRAVALLHGATLAYAAWWPRCPAWLLLWALASSQLCLMFTLLCHFDCYATLPQQPPHRLLLRSSLMPAVPLTRHAKKPRSSSAGSRAVDKAVQTDLGS